MPERSNERRVDIDLSSIRPHRGTKRLDEVQRGIEPRGRVRGDTQAGELLKRLLYESEPDVQASPCLDVARPPAKLAGARVHLAKQSGLSHPAESAEYKASIGPS